MPCSPLSIGVLNYGSFDSIKRLWFSFIGKRKGELPLKIVKYLNSNGFGVKPTSSIQAFAALYC